MKLSLTLICVLFCLGGCASNPYAKTGFSATASTGGSAQDTVLYGLSSINSYQANPTDQHFCDAMCQYARHVESNRLIAEARRREDRLRQEETEAAFDDYFETEMDAAEIADALPPVVIHQPLSDSCQPVDVLPASTLAPCL